MVESHIKWERNGFAPGLYVGWSEDEGVETGFVNYSVEGELGESLVVERGKSDDEDDPMDKMIKQAYNNAVFESMS